MVKVFVMVDGYLPGYKWGGPVQSVANMVDQLGAIFGFWILTRDRDQNDTEPYPNVCVNKWNRVGKAMVYYGSRKALMFGGVRRLIAQVGPDVVYLNNYFPHDPFHFGFTPSFHFHYLILRRLGLVPQIPTVLAPRGCFSPGWLQLNEQRNQAFIALANRLGLYDKVVWQATASLEAAEIQVALGKRVTVQVASNLPKRMAGSTDRVNRRLDKEAGTARFVFFSRITPKKNLAFALELLRDLKGNISCDIYGLKEIDTYWQECQALIETMPTNVKVTYHGVISQLQVDSMLQSYHFFLFPTRGENYGHVIFESLAAGCPVILSNETPWQGLKEKGIGWDIPLSQRETWTTVLQNCIDMGDEAYQQMATQARSFATSWADTSGTVDQSITLFRDAIKGKATGACQRKHDRAG